MGRSAILKTSEKEPFTVEASAKGIVQVEYFKSFEQDNRLETSHSLQDRYL